MERIEENELLELYNLKLELGKTGHITNCYILIEKDTKDAMLVDPSYDEEDIINILDELNVNLKVIYLTHCHGDHIAALEGVYNKYKESCKILIHENDKDGIFDDEKNCKYILDEPNFVNLKLDDIDVVKDGDIIEIGNICIEVIQTPGHTNGSSILYIKDVNCIITGDTIFSDCHGRTDLKSGSMSDMKDSLDKVFTRFNSQTIYPGHGLSTNIQNAKNRIYYGI